MIKNLTDLYDIVINEEELTTGKIKDLGYNSHDITYLVTNGFLQRISRGKYIFTNCKELEDYAYEAKRNKEFEKYHKINDYLFNNEPSSEIAKNKILYEMYDYNYDECLRAIDYLYTIDDEQCFANSCLYLMGYITNLTGSYLEKYKQITIDDLASNEQFLENNIYYYKFNQITAKIGEDNKDFNSIILFALANHARHVRYNNDQKIIKSIKNKDYMSLVDYYSQIKENRKYSRNEIICFNLLSDYTKMDYTGVTPQVLGDNAKTVNEAIKMRDYKKALSYIYKNDDYHESVIGLLLNDIVLQINNIEAQQKITDDKTVNLVDIINCLTINDMDTALYFIDKYLSIMGKTEYRGLVKNIVKLCAVEEDFTYTDAIITLDSVVNTSDYEFKPEEYVTKLYQSLASKNVDETQLLVTVINEGNKFAQKPVDIRNIENKVSVLSTDKNNNKHKKTNIKLMSKKK